MDSQDTPLFFGDWIKRQRQKLDLTQEELGRRAGCSVFAIRKIETGERKPSKQLAKLLAAALEISPEDRETFIRVARGEVNLERLRAPSLQSTPFLEQNNEPEFPTVQLPVSPTPLVGRDSELTAMARIFDNPHCRLLTLTGPGGIGKTRLAIEFACHQFTSFSGGVYYVPLAAINSPNLIIPAIAEAIEFTFSGPADPKDQLINFLTTEIKQATLFVLDNLEHLLIDPSTTGNTDATDLIAELLRQIPQINILATSRERLNLQGEWTYELHGLSVPPENFVGALLNYTAVSLFVESARRQQSDFELTADEQDAVVRICRYVGGSPLAIELASAWVGVLSCVEIANEVEKSLDLLTSSLRDIPGRHRSIRATFDHSWGYLTEDERTALRQLSVFQGGFNRAAAEEITGASLPILASLVSKSLIRRKASGRYDFHELIRQYASSHFSNDPQQPLIINRHCAYYLSLAGTKGKDLKSAGQQEIIRELTEEMENIRTAWTWAFKCEDAALIGQAVRSLGWFYETTGLLDQGINEFEQLTNKIGNNPLDKGWESVLGSVLAQQGFLFFRKGDFATAEARLKKSIAVLRPLGDETKLTDALIFLGIISHLNGELDYSLSLIEEGLACARAGGDLWFTAYGIFNLGYIASLSNHYDEGYEKMMEGLALWREIGDPQSIALGLNFISPTLIKLGHFEEAEKYLQESLMLCEKSGHYWGMGTACRYLGVTKMVKGDLAEAQELFRKSLDIFCCHTTGWDIASSQIFLGEATMLKGDAKEAKKIYLEAVNTAQNAKSLPLLLDAMFGLANLKAFMGDFEQAVLFSTFVQNHPYSSKETVERASRLIQETMNKLPTYIYQDIIQKAAHHSLDTIVGELS